MMINTVESLRGLYVALGGNIAEVAGLNTIPELLTEISTVAQAAATELPAVKSVDNGKVLTVVNSKWAKADLPTELPAVTAENNGNVLTVSSGAWSAQAPATELPSVSSSDKGKVLTVSNTGNWAKSQNSIDCKDITVTGTTAGNNVTVTMPTGYTGSQISEYLNANTNVRAVHSNLDSHFDVKLPLVAVIDFQHLIFHGYYDYTSGTDTLYKEVTIIIHLDISGGSDNTGEVYTKAFTPST